MGKKANKLTRLLVCLLALVMLLGAAPMAALAEGDDAPVDAADESGPVQDDVDSSLPQDAPDEDGPEDDDSALPPADDSSQADDSAEADGAGIVTAEDPPPPFAGTGADLANAYEIADEDDLVMMATIFNSTDSGDGYAGYRQAGKFYKLTGSITLTATNWEPIASGLWPFAGNFYGAGKTITGLAISGEVDDYAGLFGWANGAYFNNVKLATGNINATGTGDVYVGALVGRAIDSTISNCGNTGVSVTSAGNFTGGLVGRMEGGFLTEGRNSAAVAGGAAAGSSYPTTATAYVGGIAGEVSGVQVSACRNDGNVGNTRVANAGGIAGRVTGSTVTDCLSLGTVQGQPAAGGIAGMANGTAQITRCVALNTKVTTAHQGTPMLGGIVGQMYGGTPKVEDSVVIVPDIGSTNSSAQTNVTGRIVGHQAAGTLANNCAYAHITRGGKAVTWPKIGATKTDGTDKEMSELKAHSLWAGLGYGYTDTPWVLPEEGTPGFPYLSIFGAIPANMLPDFPEVAGRILVPTLGGGKGLTAAVFQSHDKDTTLIKLRVTDSKAGAKVKKGDFEWTMTKNPGTVTAPGTDPKDGSPWLQAITTKSNYQEATLRVPAKYYTNGDGRQPITVTVVADGNPDYTVTFTVTIIKPVKRVELEDVWVPENEGPVVLTPVFIGNDEAPIASVPSDIKVAWSIQNHGEDEAVMFAGESGTSGDGPITLDINEPGTATVTARATWGGGSKTATCRVVVAPVLAGVDVLPAGLTLRAGQTRILTALPKPRNAILPEGMRWESDDTNGDIVTVDASTGKVRAIGPGTANITLVGTGLGSAPSVPVTVWKPAETFGFLNGQGNPLRLEDTWDGIVGDYFDLAVKDDDAPFAPQKLVWTSSDERVVTVHSVATGNNILGATVDSYDGTNYSFFRLRFNAPGTAVVQVASAGGSTRHTLLVTVRAEEEPHPAGEPFGLDKDYILLTQASLPGEIGLVGYAAEDNVTFSVMDAETRAPIANDSPDYPLDPTSPNLTLDSSVGYAVVLYKRDGIAAPHGRYILAITSTSAYGARQTAECRIDIPDPAATTAPGMRLATSAVTIYTKQDEASASIPIWRDTDMAKRQLPLRDDATIAFTGDANGDALEFAAVNDTTLAVKVKDNATPKSSYSGKLSVTVGGDTVNITGTLKVTVSGSLPKLTATAPKVNLFQHSPGFSFTADKAARSIEPTFTLMGRQVAPIACKLAKNAPSFIEVAETAGLIDALYVKPGTKATNGTLSLKVQLPGWGNEWFSASLKVARSHTPAGVKLASTKVKVHASAGADASLNLRIANLGTPMALKVKSSKNTLVGLGITGVRVMQPKTDAELDAYFDGAYDPTAGDPDKYLPWLRVCYQLSASTYKIQDLYEVKDYNPATGAFRLVPRHGTAPGYDINQLPGGKLMLEATVDGTGGTVKLPVTVTPVKTTAKVSLKASKSSFTLNPNLTGGDSIRVTLTPSIVGVDTDELDFDCKWYDSKGKNPVPRTEVTPGVQREGNVLTLTAPEGVGHGKTYKLKVTCYGLYQKNDIWQSAGTTLTVKLQKQHATKYAPKVSLSTKGKVDITGGGAVTITTKLSNTMEGISALSPEDVMFQITYPVKNKKVVDCLNPITTTSDSDAFILRRTGPNTWTLRVNNEKRYAGTYLPTGTYTIQLLAGAKLEGGHVLEESAVKSFTVAASKPKATRSPTTVTLNKKDPDSYQLVTVKLPGNLPPLKENKAPSTEAGHEGEVDLNHMGVVLKGGWAKADATDTGFSPGYLRSKKAKYEVVEVDHAKGLYAIRYNPDYTGTRKGATLTLELWAEGHRNIPGAKPTATTTVKVVVK